jgi:hypothetical protein
MHVALTAFLLGAEPTHVTLDHTSAADCPDAEWLKGNVTARLGYSPFATDAGVAVRTRLTCTASGCQGLLEVSTPGVAARRRTLVAPPGQCRELAESLALALALVVDPQLLSRPAPPPPEENPPAPAPRARAPLAAPAPPPEPPPPEARTPTAFVAALTGHGALGLSPSATGGAGFALGVRVGVFGIYAEGRFDWPSDLSLPTGRISTQLLLGSVLPCGHFKGLGVCLQLGGGALQVTGDLPGGARRTGPIALVGGRVAYDWMFLSWLGLHAHVGLAGVATRVTVVAEGAPVWVTSQVAGDAALGALVMF